MSESDHAIDLAYENFLVKPSAANYLNVRSLLLANPRWIRRDEELVQLGRLSRKSDLVGMMELAERMIPAWIVCPRFHFLLATTAGSVGDDETAELERFQFESCLQGILASGDGSRARPYFVVHTSDIRDAMRALGVTAVGQEVLARGDSLCDAMHCLDGAKLYFVRSETIMAEWSELQEAQQSLFLWN
ncbi:MAG: hypothetical protein KDA60_16080 [Planctomycetales bacterium]|nr:hypothetical protein [Planctomycetales bacterium]